MAELGNKRHPSVFSLRTGLLAFVLAGGMLGVGFAQESWRQWGGPNRNFMVEASGLADSWPEDGPPIIWSRMLGTGHSSIVTDNGRLFMMYRVGNGRERGGPFDAEEIVIALDATTGETLWEHTYPAKLEDFNFGSGPHSTPLIVGNRLFTIGTNKQLYAFDTRSGDVLWSHDLVEELGSPSLLIRPVVKAGYGCSPIAFEDNIICSVGGPGQSVMSFRQDDGTVVWRSGDFLTSQVPPILIEVAGRPQLVIVGGGTVNGLDPSNGAVLWSHPHDPGNDLNCSTPLWGSDNVLVVSSAYKAGSRALRLSQDGDATMPEELWFTRRSRFMFLGAIRLGDHVYGTSGDCWGPIGCWGIGHHLAALRFFRVRNPRSEELDSNVLPNSSVPSAENELMVMAISRYNVAAELRPGDVSPSILVFSFRLSSGPPGRLLQWMLGGRVDSVPYPLLQFSSSSLLYLHFHVFTAPLITEVRRRLLKDARGRT